MLGLPTRGGITSSVRLNPAALLPLEHFSVQEGQWDPSNQPPLPLSRIGPELPTNGRKSRVYQQTLFQP